MQRQFMPRQRRRRLQHFQFPNNISDMPLQNANFFFSEAATSPTSPRGGEIVAVAVGINIMTWEGWERRVFC